MKKIFSILAWIFLATIACDAAAETAASADTITVDTSVRRKIISRLPESGNPDRLETVVVDNDTLQILLPKYHIGRYDRGLYNHLFIPRGQWAFGLTASYGEFDTDDVQLLSILKDFNFKGKLYSLSPSVAYFIRNNQAVGLRFSYNRGIGDLNTMAFDFDDDMNFTLSNVSYYSQSYNLAMFYRNYIGLSNLKRFGVFNEVELEFGSGSSRFKRYYNNELRDTRTVSTSVGLNFSPGVTVYIMDYVSFNVSFGVFGVNLKKETQRTNDRPDGSRFTSGANFKFNLFNIKFGASVNI